MTIQVLPLHIINQIAAGEVVERPASVVKELVENSLDAKATRIEIDIEKGGYKLIRVRDNGKGIAKDELVLALTNHATSKIFNLEDLNYITSMGFRGEALASINSISRLTITSRPIEQLEGWQVNNQNHDLMPRVKPTSHLVGTTVEVLDLFHNIPARRKFMRTEKTEFIYIDDIVRRIALAYFNITFILRHNRKIIRQYKAINEKNKYLSRLTKLCGKIFVEEALDMSYQNGDLDINGWVAYPTNKHLPKIQYIYVNQRIIKNQLINHAIRQAFQEKTLEIQKPAYILFIKVDFNQVDINVHPSKHAVRFYHARLVHDFVYQAIKDVLNHTGIKNELNKEKKHVIENNLTLQNNYTTYMNFSAISREMEHSIPNCVNMLANETKGKIRYKTLHFGQDVAIKTFKNILQQSILNLTRYSFYNENDQIKENNICQKPVQMTYSTGNKKSMQYNFFTQREFSKKYNQLTATQLVNYPQTVFNRSMFIQMKSARSLSTISHLYTLSRVLTLIKPCYALLEIADTLRILSLPVAERYLFERQLTTTNGSILRTQPLLIPLRMIVQKEKTQILDQYKTLLHNIGIILHRSSYQVILHAVPFLCHQANLKNFIFELLNYLYNKKSVTHNQVISWIAYWRQYQPIVWNYSFVTKLVSELDQFYPQWKKQPSDALLVTLDLKAAIKTLRL